MSTLMSDPVILPSSRVTVDRSTIARHLLRCAAQPSYLDTFEDLFHISNEFLASLVFGFFYLLHQDYLSNLLFYFSVIRQILSIGVPSLWTRSDQTQS